MNLTFLQNEFVLALCWTLIHSIWQGLLLAAATGIVMVSTRRSHPRKRYTILTGLFFLFITGAVITFCRELGLAASHASTVSTELLAQQIVPINEITNATVNSSVPSQTILQRFTDYFNTHAALIVTIWFIVFMAKFLKLSANLVYVQRLKSYKVYEPADEWKEKIQELMRKLGIHKKIRLMESGIVKVPVTMGMLKPVILLPFGLLSHLPADEIEAILLHELAHIQRRDYFVNLLQSLAETIFFFNPALLWLSSMIREERENCCDDLAIAVTNNKTNFINALISFQEYHFSNPSHSMAFPGNKNQLLNRVKRIISDRNKTLNAAEKSVISFGIALLILFSFVAAQNAPLKQDKTAQKEKVTPAPAGKRMNPAAKPKAVPGSIQSDGTGLSPDLSLVSNKITALELQPLAPLSTDMVPLDGALASLDELQDTTRKEYKNFSTNVNTEGDTRTMEFTVTTKSGQEFRFKKVNDVLKELFVNGKQIPETEYGNYKEEMDQIEKIYQRKQEEKKAKREEDRVKHLQSVENRRHELELKMQHKEAHRLQEDKIKEHQQDKSKHLQSVENRQHELQLKIQSKESNKLLEDEKRKLQNEYRESRLKLNEQKQKSESIERLLKEKEKEIRLNKSITYQTDVKPGFKKDITLQLKPEFKKDITLQLKPAIKKDITIQLKPVKADSAKPYKKNPDGPSPEKLEKMRIQRAEADERRNAAASVIRNIIEDLEKENIKIDTQKSWFALDKIRLVVDGVYPPKELHEKLMAKYVTKTGGWYYGNVKVEGRGIFLDNHEVPAK